MCWGKYRFHNIAHAGNKTLEKHVSGFFNYFRQGDEKRTFSVCERNTSGASLWFRNRAE